MKNWKYQLHIEILTKKGRTKFAVLPFAIIPPLFLNSLFFPSFKIITSSPLIWLLHWYLGWAVQRSRPPWCDGRYQGDQPSAIKNICRGYNLLKSGLGQGFRVEDRWLAHIAKNDASIGAPRMFHPMGERGQSEYCVIKRGMSTDYNLWTLNPEPWTDHFSGKV